MDTARSGTTEETGVSVDLDVYKRQVRDAVYV